MKRAALGGATRGPVAPTRQRRTLRAVQMGAVVAALALAALAALRFGEANGEAVVLLAMSVAAAAGAFALQGPEGDVRLPTPARLEELAGRAEAVAIQKVEADMPERSDQA